MNCVCKPRAKDKDKDQSKSHLEAKDISIIKAYTKSHSLQSSDGPVCSLCSLSFVIVAKCVSWLYTAIYLYAFKSI